jgi:hypothetical protein
MENIQSPASSTQPAKPPRPTFLTVLCILTFIGSAWGIISGISNYMNADVASSIVGEAMDEAKDKISEETTTSESKIAEKVFSGVSDLMDPAKMRKNALFQVAANVLTLLGGLLMFQLKKTGFWVYLVGTVCAILAPVIVYGASNLLSLGMTMVYGFFGVLFVVLYAINLKHLR